MNFSTEEQFITYMQESGYETLDGPNGIIHFQVTGPKVAIYRWNTITKSADQMVLSVHDLKEIAQSTIH